MQRALGHRPEDLRRNTADLATLYRDFRGKDPSVEPLLESRGLK